MGKPRELHLACLDELFDRTRHILDGHLIIHAMLVEKIEGMHLEALEAVVGRIEKGDAVFDGCSKQSDHLRPIRWRAAGKAQSSSHRRMMAFVFSGRHPECSSWLRIRRPNGSFFEKSTYGKTASAI
jgi:hypothetical protein